MEFGTLFKQNGRNYKWAYLEAKGKKYKRLMVQIHKQETKKAKKKLVWVFVGSIFILGATSIGISPWIPIRGQAWLLELFVRSRLGIL